MIQNSNGQPKYQNWNKIFKACFFNKRIEKFKRILFLDFNEYSADKLLNWIKYVAPTLIVVVKAVYTINFNMYPRRRGTLLDQLLEANYFHHPLGFTPPDTAFEEQQDPAAEPSSSRRQRGKRVKYEGSVSCLERSK